MRYALIKNGEVRNVILWDGETALELRDGETLLPEAEATELPRYSPEVESPKIEGVPKLTIKRRLGAKWATLRAIIATLPEDTQDEWNLAQVIEADDPIFVANAAFLQAALELTEEEFTALLTP